jgi:hypothetical protein
MEGETGRHMPFRSPQYPSASSHEECLVMAMKDVFFPFACRRCTQMLFTGCDTRTKASKVADRDSALLRFTPLSLPFPSPPFPFLLAVW